MSKSKAEKEALGYTLLELCFKSELNSHDVRSIIRCIAEEADTNVRDKWGHTSLMYASRDGHSDVVHELLVRGGADPNMANRNDGWTSLMFASFRNHSFIVANLLAHGADSMTVTSRWGYTALDIARNEGHVDVVKLLEAHQRLSHSKTAVRLQTEHVPPSESWELKLLKCGCCGAVLSRRDFTSHCIELHAGDKDFNWKSSDVEIYGDEPTSQCDLVEPLSDTLELGLVQSEYDDLVQKVELDVKLRQVQKEAALLMHSWPEEWFLKSKKVPKNPLDPETEEVLLARSLNATAFARSVGSHLLRPLTPPDDS